MAMLDLAELRAAIEELLRVKGEYLAAVVAKEDMRARRLFDAVSLAEGHYRRLTSLDRTLALLDRLEAAERVCEAVEGVYLCYTHPERALAMLAAWRKEKGDE